VESPPEAESPQVTTAPLDFSAAKAAAFRYSLADRPGYWGVSCTKGLPDATPEASKNNREILKNTLCNYSPKGESMQGLFNIT
jgi:hypothetical protein